MAIIRRQYRKREDLMAKRVFLTVNSIVYFSFSLILVKRESRVINIKIPSGIQQRISPEFAVWGGEDSCRKGWSGELGGLPASKTAKIN